MTAEKKQEGQDIYFPEDGSEQWLNEVDVRLAVGILQSFLPANPEVLEIGVWKGGWTSSVLMNVAGAQVVGVDPYPGVETVRVEMLARIKALNLTQRFRLYRSLPEVPGPKQFDLIHIDGDHGEEATWKDLEFAFSRLRPGGVIVVDDFSHPLFPGVASALYRFSFQFGLRVFLVTKSKAYLAHAPRARELYSAALEAQLGSPTVLLSRSYEEARNFPYAQSAKVLGQPVLFARIKRSSPKPSPTRSAFRSLTPPILLHALIALKGIASRR